MHLYFIGMMENLYFLILTLKVLQSLFTYRGQIVFWKSADTILLNIQSKVPILKKKNLDLRSLDYIKTDETELFSQLLKSNKPCSKL